MGKKIIVKGSIVVRPRRSSKATDKAIAELIDNVILKALSQSAPAPDEEPVCKEGAPAVQVMRALPMKKRKPPKAKSGGMSLEEALERNGGKFTLSGLKSALLPAGG